MAIPPAISCWSADDLMRRTPTANAKRHPDRCSSSSAPPPPVVNENDTVSTDEIGSATPTARCAWSRTFPGAGRSILFSDSTAFTWRPSPLREAHADHRGQ